MKREDVLKVRDARKFRPVLISLDNGDRYELKHPENLNVMPDGLCLVYDDHMILAIFDCDVITSIEPLRKGRR